MLYVMANGCILSCKHTCSGVGESRYRRLKSGWEVARQVAGVVVNHCVSSLRTPGAATAREDVWISGGTTL